MTLRTFAVFIILAIAIAALAAGGYRFTQQKLHDSINTTLQGYGFKNATVQELSFEKNHVVFTNITLDEDNFSTIDAIRIFGGYSDIIRQKQPLSLVLDGLKLTGSFNRETGLNIFGWQKQTLGIPAYNEITLNGAQLDLDTSAGGLRFQAKSQAKRQPNGRLNWQAAVWGIQHQIKIETTWNGHIYPDGKWITDVEFDTGSLNLERLQASRLSGWFILDKTKNLIPEISGQIDAGKMTFGDISFNNLSLTFDGPFNDYKLIAKGKVAGFQNMLATLDLTNITATPKVKATIETSSLDNLITFLDKLQTSDTQAGSLTSLLLTKGNLERLRKDIAKMKFDTLQLEIYGPLYDLAGKVVVKTFKDGVTQRQVISLDPGDNPQNG